jgi:hypothetical protein
MLWGHMLALVSNALCRWLKSYSEFKFFCFHYKV